MKLILLYTLLSFPLAASAQSNEQNYVLESIFLDTEASNRIVNVSYFDGIGNKVEDTTTASGSGKSVYTFSTYDSKGREAMSYLPVPIGNSLSFEDVSTVTSASSSYYAGDVTAYQRRHYDAMDRVIEEDIPGAQWHAGNKSTAIGYFTNTAEDKVLHYEAPLNTVSLIKPEASSSRYYPAGALSKEVRTDADGNSVTVFQDLRGNTVLERGDIGDTYFVYNALGQLRFVLSPEFQQSENKDLYAYEYRYDAHGSIVWKTLPGCEYSQYWYDKEKHLVFSQDAQLRVKGLYRFTLCDTKGRPVIQGLCSSCNRELENVDLHVSFPIGIANTACFMDTGYIINVQGYIDTSTAIIEQVSYYDTYRFLSGSYAEEFAKISATSSTNGVGRLTGTISAASNGQNVFRVNYYDVKGNITKVLEKGLDDHVCHTVNGYTFTNQLDSTYTSVDVGYGEPFRVRNSYTYNIHNNMPESLSVSLSHGDSYHTNTISYEYDDLNRLVRTVRPEGVGDIAYSYDLHGWLTDIESNSFKESLFYADGFGRPCYNGNISSMQWQNSTYDRQRGYKFYYDKLNRLTSAIYDEDTSGSNIQGLIKGEKVTANKTNELSALRSKFERIATSVQPYEAEPLLEAIAEIDEDCQECVMEEDSLQLQDFEATENLNNNIACYDEYVEYDLNGNITHLQRYGRMQDDTFGTIDNLHVSLNGNQLSSVTDEAAKVVSEGAIDFNNADDGQSEYTYNSCGSLTSDTGRGIAMIEYDNCNNPLRIQFTNGNVTRYVYATDGRKLRTIYYTAMPNITVAVGETKVLAPAEILCSDSVDYLMNGNLILKNGRIDKYLFAEGYCQGTENFICLARPVMPCMLEFFDEKEGVFKISEPTEEEWNEYRKLMESWGEAMNAARAIDNFSFNYYNRDHLGNIREVVNDVGQISQVTNYYPFGSPYCDTQSTINPELQPFKYNGKELDMMHGLNAYDYGARQYYSPLPVWDRVDPLAEKYYNVSPYAYCNNNPVNAVDPDGEDWIAISIGNTMWVYYDSNISSQQDIIQNYYKGEYPNDNYIKYIGKEGAIYNNTSDSKNLIYSLHADGTFCDKDNNIITSDVHINDSFGELNLGSDINAKLNNVHSNWYGSYLGPNNPQYSDSQKYFYAVPPIDNLDYAAYVHDRGYDTKQAVGPYGVLFNLDVAPYDLLLARMASEDANKTGDMYRFFVGKATGILFSIIGTTKSILK